jgi:hypothetical protein
VLLVLWTGRKPTKRQWEALQLYWVGCVSVTVQVLEAKNTWSYGVTQG